ncbi:MAG: NUDIX hydrolase [Candidatus Rokuibacteriota bacterium]
MAPRLDPSSRPMTYAAGGLVWRDGADGPEMAIIYRNRHKDWTLPKGKLNPGETFGVAARREVREEILCEALRRGLAGVIQYRPARQDLKTVVFWSMRLADEDEFVPSEEVVELRWMRPEAVLTQLTHPEEQRMVQRWTDAIRTRFARRRSPAARRLSAELEIFRAGLSARVARLKADDRPGLSWVDEAIGLVERAEAALAEGDVDTGWRCFHGALRLELTGMSNPELAALVRTLEPEADTDKIRGWRKKAIQDLLVRAKAMLGAEAPSAIDDIRESLRQALLVRHEASDNEYYRIGLLRSQLVIMYVVAAVLVAVVLAANYWARDSHDPERWTLVQLVVSGMLGAAFSAVISLARTDAVRRIPEQIVNNWITGLRPVLGGIAALAIYVFLQGDIVNLGALTPPRMLAIAFVAGFVDQFVPRAAEAFASTASSDKKGT